MNYLFIVVTAAGSFIYLFLLTKLTGNRQISEMGMFDYISSITIGSIAAELAIDIENIWEPIIAMAVYGILTALMPLLSSKFSLLRSFLEGKTYILMENGILYEESFKKTKIDIDEFLYACREKGFFHLEEIQLAVFERNGKISILPVSGARPATPKDMNLQVAQAYPDINVIADGKVFSQNLKFCKKDEKWLEKELAKQKVKKEDVFLAVISDNNTLRIYRKSEGKQMLC